MDSDNSVYLKVENLAKAGISAVVIEANFNKLGRILQKNEYIKISQKNEGNYIEFQTLDQISVLVDVSRAVGGFNKVE